MSRPLARWLGFACLAALSTRALGLQADPPLGATPAWAERGHQTWSWFGASLAGLGDLDLDGRADLAIGAPLYDAGLLVNAGLVRVFLGSPAGLAGEPAIEWTGELPGANFGAALAAGDFDGDGRIDLAVGAPDHGEGLAAPGRVTVHWNVPGSLETRLPGNPRRAAGVSTLDGDQSGAQFGAALASAGDVDGDGDDELLVGAPYFDGAAGLNAGRAALFRWNAREGSWSAFWTFEGTRAQAACGFAVAAAGDLDADGYADVLVGAPDLNDVAHAGAVHVFAGAALPAATPAWTLAGDPGEQLGYAVAGPGDVDLDGFDDLVVGAPFHGADFVHEGRIALHRGRPEGPDPRPAWTAAGGAAHETLGRGLSAAGRVDLDPWPDLVASFGHEPAGNVGGIALFRGSALGFELAWVQNGEHANGWLAGIGAGDLNGDGYGDVAAGAWGADPVLVDEGLALAFLGKDADAAQNYCLATVNSSGAPALVDVAGKPSAARGTLSVYASPLPAGGPLPGLFFYGDQEALAPFWDGYLCVGGHLQRGAMQVAENGVLWDLLSDRTAAWSPGSVWNFQAWFRDPRSLTGANLSNAVAVAFPP